MPLMEMVGAFIGRCRPERTHEMTTIEGPLMMAIPNMTGPMHIANAMIFWLTAREARRRGIPWGWYFDDTFATVAAAPTYATEQATHQSCRDFERLLDVKADFHLSKSTRYLRYWEVIDKSVADGLAFVACPGTVLLKCHGGYAHDMIRGRMMNHELQLCWSYRVESRIRYAVDMYDYRVPLHIRGKDLLNESTAALPFVRMVQDLWADDLRPETKYIHLPIIWDEHEQPLDKRRGVPGPLEFTQWAEQFQTAQQRRRALAALVMPDGFPENYHLSDALDVATVIVNSHGKRILAKGITGGRIFLGRKYQSYTDPSVKH